MLVLSEKWITAAGCAAGLRLDEARRVRKTHIRKPANLRQVSQRLPIRQQRLVLIVRKRRTCAGLGLVTMSNHRPICFGQRSVALQTLRCRDLIRGRRRRINGNGIAIGVGHDDFSGRLRSQKRLVFFFRNFHCIGRNFAVRIRNISHSLVNCQEGSRPVDVIVIKTRCGFRIVDFHGSSSNRKPMHIDGACRVMTNRKLRGADDPACSFVDSAAVWRVVGGRQNIVKRIRKRNR